MPRFSLLRWIAAALALVVLCSACGSVPQVVSVDFVQPPPPPVAVAAPARSATGSLYHGASYRASFEDRRARMVGDTVTIQIIENVAASQKSASTANRTATMDAAVLAIPWASASLVNKLALGTTSENDFSGKGGTESANTFSGSITTTVVSVLPNGHLVIAGEKQIGVNQNVDVLRFSGTVDPLAILPGSFVSSTQVANVRIESKGRGAQAEAQTVGWLQRFFMALSPF